MISMKRINIIIQLATSINIQHIFFKYLLENNCVNVIDTVKALNVIYN